MRLRCHTGPLSAGAGLLELESFVLSYAHFSRKRSISIPPAVASMSEPLKDYSRQQVFWILFTLILCGDDCRVRFATFWRDRGAGAVGVGPRSGRTGLVVCPASADLVGNFHSAHVCGSAPSSSRNPLYADRSKGKFKNVTVLDLSAA